MYQAEDLYVVGLGEGVRLHGSVCGWDGTRGTRVGLHGIVCGGRDKGNYRVGLHGILTLSSNVLCISHVALCACKADIYKTKINTH